MVAKFTEIQATGEVAELQEAVKDLAKNIPDQSRKGDMKTASSTYQAAYGECVIVDASEVVEVFLPKATSRDKGKELTIAARAITSGSKIKPSDGATLNGTSTEFTLLNNFIYICLCVGEKKWLIK